MSVAAGTPSPSAALGAQRPIVAITSGEPAGVGPELCLRIVEREWPARLVVLGDIELMRARAAALGSSVRVVPFEAAVAAAPDTVEVIHAGLARPAVAGKLDPANGAYVLRLLDHAIAGCLDGRFAAMVTAPVHKGVICEGLGARDTMPFTGHTEYLAEQHPGAWPSGAKARVWARCAAAEMHSGFTALRQQCPMNCGIEVRLNHIAPDLQADVDRLQELWLQGLDQFGGPYLAGPAFSAVDAFFCPVAFRVQTYGLVLDERCMIYVRQLLQLPAMQLWFDQAVHEPWIDPSYERLCLSNGQLIKSLRPIPPQP